MENGGKVQVGGQVCRRTAKGGWSGGLATGLGFWKGADGREVTEVFAGRKKVANGGLIGRQRRDNVCELKV
jgi:hypothetical protein